MRRSIAVRQSAAERLIAADGDRGQGTAAICRAELVEVRRQPDVGRLVLAEPAELVDLIEAIGRHARIEHALADRARPGARVRPVSYTHLTLPTSDLV